MHSVKLGYLVCAVTVHLLLFLFEYHGNEEYVRALASVRACARTCTCDLSSKREHQFKDFGRSRLGVGGGGGYLRHKLGTGVPPQTHPINVYWSMEKVYL